MKNTKLVIAITAFAAIGILATGAVFAHYTTIPTNTYPNDPYNQDPGFWGWLGGCFNGYNEPDYSYHPDSNPVPDTDNDVNPQPQTPLPPQQPYHPPRYDNYYPPRYPTQGHYPRYGRGCMGW